jgi:hypothetical protein
MLYVYAFFWVITRRLNFICYIKFRRRGITQKKSTQHSEQVFHFFYFYFIVNFLYILITHVHLYGYEIFFKTPVTKYFGGGEGLRIRGFV